MENPTDLGQATRRKSLILLSGGLDSSANLAFTQYFDEPVLAITADYGQRAAQDEIRAAKAIAKHYGVAHEVIDLKWLGALGGSALTTQNEIPDLAVNLLDDAKASGDAGKLVWVPNRNGVLINVAAAIAESRKIPQIIVGFNKEEAATFPDNSSQFMGVSTLALKYSTSNAVKVVCYTDLMTKSELVQAAKNLEHPFPFDLIWSCYKSSSETGGKMCGACESCRRFVRATEGIKL